MNEASIANVELEILNSKEVEKLSAQRLKDEEERTSGLMKLNEPITDKPKDKGEASLEIHGIAGKKDSPQLDRQQQETPSEIREPGEIQVSPSQTQVNNPPTGDNQQARPSQSIGQAITAAPRQAPTDPNVRQPQTPYEHFLVSSFKMNLTLNKPRITCFSYICSLIIFGSLLAYAMSQDNPDLTVFLYGYYACYFMEMVLLIFFSQASAFLPIKFSYWSIMPWAMKLIEVGFLHADVTYGTKISLYFSFLLLLPWFFSNNPRFCYAHIALTQGCLPLIIGIAELLVVIKLTTETTMSFASIFYYLFYYHIVVGFFTGLVMILSIISIIVQLCGRPAVFSLRIRITQIFLGTDTLFLILLSWYFAIFASNYWSYTALNETKDAVQLKDREKYYQAFSEARKALYTVLIVGTSYVAVRLPLSLCLVWNFVYPMAPAVDRTKRNNDPKVGKPKESNTILRLFRINTNFYSEKPPTDTEKGQNAEVKKEEDDGLCTICLAEPANCIILDCRHAGVCKVCSIDMMKRSDACPFCRKSIQKVCVVLPIEDNNYKVIEEIVV